MPSNENISRPINRGGRYQVLLISLLLAGSTLLVFWPVIHHDFVYYDDQDYVFENAQVQAGLTLSGVAWAFSAPHAGNWHPITWFSHMLDAQWYGLKAGGHHFTNLLLHVMNTLLLFGLLRGWTGAPWRSAFAAGLFALHPLHVESVAWVAERKDVLSTCFFLLTLWAYGRYTSEAKAGRRRSGIFYVITLLLFACGLMSKPMLVTLPFVLLLLDYWPLSRVTFSDGRAWVQAYGRLLREKLPLFLLILPSCFITFVAQDRQGVVASLDTLPLLSRIAGAASAYGLYLGKMIWPQKLAVFYPYPNSWPAVPVAVCGFLLLAISLLAIVSIRRHPYVIVGWCWYLGTLVPVIGLVHVGLQSMADRYTYIPLMGIFIILAWGVGDLTQRLPGRRWMLGIGGVAVLLACMARTRNQVAHWKNTETLFRHALAVTTRNYIAHYTYGSELANQNRISEAYEQFVEAVRIRPSYSEAQNNLGAALIYQGKTDEAIERYRIAIQFKPRMVKAHYNLGRALEIQGKLEEAVPEYEEAIRLNPDYLEARKHLASALARQDKVYQAMEQYSLAAQLAPNDAEIHYDLANLYASRGMIQEAKAQYLEVLRLQPDSIGTKQQLGLLLAQSGQSDQALECFNEVVRLKPDDPQARYNLALVLVKLGRRQDAAPQYREAIRLKPDFPEARQQLGLLLAQNGQSDQALEHFTEVVRLKPEDPQARYHLALALVTLDRRQDAVPQFREAIRLRPDFPVALNDLAWILATHPDPKLRDGDEAVRLAGRACELSKNEAPRFLGTLDAAYAEAGRMDEAVRAAQKTRDQAVAAGEKDIADAAEERLKSYQAGKPYRVP